MTHEITLKVGSPHQLRDHVRRAAGHCTPGGSVRHTLEDLLAQIEEQMPKPAVPEPEAFGSIIRAHYPDQSKGTENPLWQRSPRTGHHYWISNSGVVEVWSELTDVEVLRVGLGGDYREGLHDGRASVVASFHTYLISRLDQAITAERKHELEKAIQAVEELAP